MSQVSAAHPLVKRHTYRLFRLCSYHYVTKGVIFIGQLPLHCDRRYLRGCSVCPAARQQCFATSPLTARHANCSVVGCKNQHKCQFTTEQQKKVLQNNRRDSGCVSFFNDNVPAAVHVSLDVCANHFTSDCFSNEGQYKAGFASTLTLVKGSVPTILIVYW